MTSLVPEVLLNVSDEAPSPSRDFCQLQVTKKEVIYRWWHITPRSMGKQSRPGENRSTHEDFLHDSKLQSEVWRVFGKNTLEYVKNICSGQLNYLQYMPKAVLIQVLSFLELEDVNRFACTCRLFRELSESDDLWEVLYSKNMLVRSTNQNVQVEELRSLAKEIGWKRMYFTNRIQLQRLLNRLREKATATQQVGANVQKIALKVSQNGAATGEEEGPKSNRPDVEPIATESTFDIESVRWPSARRTDEANPTGKSYSAEGNARREYVQKAHSAADFPERAEAVLANLPPEVRYLEALGPAVERPAPQLRTGIEDEADDGELERPPMDEHTKQERVKAWLKEVDNDQSAAAPASASATDRLDRNMNEQSSSPANPIRGPTPAVEVFRPPKQK